MKAVGLYRYLPVDDPESLRDLEIDKPTPPTGRDLLVRVHAISVNPVDVKTRAPKPRTETNPRILGWDAAGVVEAAGAECTLFAPGDAVYYAGDLTRPGSNSEFHLVDERIVGRKPNNLSFAEAAALPLTTLTAWEGLFDRLGIAQQPEHNHGKSVLIIGAAGGVGSVATQLAHWAGLTVIGTASRPHSAQWAKEHGADSTINHYQPFAPQLQQLGLASVDYIMCLNATERHWDDMVENIAPEGKICSIVETEQPLALTALQPKSATFVWEFMFTRSMFRTPDMIEQHRALNRAAELLETGILKTTLTECLTPITAVNLRQAHAELEKGGMVGKIVLEHFPS